MELHDYLGRRFEFVDGSAPDVTVNSYDMAHGTVRLHIVGGSRQTMPLTLFLRAVREGTLQESDKAPFCHDHETKFERERARRKAVREAERADMARERSKHANAVGFSTRGGIRYFDDPSLKGRKR
jgi:hypothetical protein